MAFLHHHEPSGAPDRAGRLRSTLTAAGDLMLTVPPPCVWDDRRWCPAAHADAEHVVDLRDAPAPVPDWTA
jgi:hypothetical protein